MSTQSEDDVPPVRERPRERSVSDVAREAFESRLIEGDEPATRPRHTPSPPASGGA